MNTKHLYINRFVFVYIIGLFICFSPFKKLSLFTPLLSVFLLVFFVNARPKYNLAVLFFFVIIYTFIGFIYYFINEDFLWPNFLIFFVTYSPFLFILMSFDDNIEKELLQKISNVTIKVLFFEAILGIVQWLYNGLFCSQIFDGGTGDASMGTVNPTFGVGDGLGSNVYYAIGLSSLSVLAISVKLSQKRRISTFVLITLILGWVAASVVHSIFLLVGSMLITLMLVIFFMPKTKISFISKQLKVIIGSTVLIFLIIVGIVYLLPNSIVRLKSYYEKTFDSQRPSSTKSLATITTFKELGNAKEYQKYIGLGPGQYCSKASMILSGTYLSAKIPSFLESVSPDLKRYILPIWLEYKARKWQAGSTYFPFFSWLSLYGEFGFVGCGLLLLLIIFFCKRLVENVNQNNFILILGLLIVVIYIFLLGVQDNYWEWSQFILPIVLFSKAIYYVVMKD